MVLAQGFAFFPHSLPEPGFLVLGQRLQKCLGPARRAWLELGLELEPYSGTRAMPEA